MINRKEQKTKQTMVTLVDKVQKKISDTNLSKNAVNSGYLKGKQLHQWHMTCYSGLK
jgi:hypothetical protein